MFAKLQYISQGHTAKQQVQNIQEALEAGCTWIQLRYKNASIPELTKIAEQVRKLCSTYKAMFIINDHPQIANQCDADGVHLGLQDMPIATAKSILGANKILGGTANTFEDLLQRYHEGCHYAGAGPFRFTTSKEKLSPIIGLEGYQRLMRQMMEHGISLPVYAIGGIVPNDVHAIMEAGVYGIAISGAITNSTDKFKTIHQINSSLYAKAYNR